MSKSDLLEEATSRLTAALEVFESTVADRRHDDLTAEALQEQLQSLTDSLGAVREKTGRLEAANDEVAERIEEIIGSIKSILQPG
jgi:septal ring factor EnvC (AmiA/AmiB activator)